MMMAIPASVFLCAASATTMIAAAVSGISDKSWISFGLFMGGIGLATWLGWAANGAMTRLKANEESHDKLKRRVADIEAEMGHTQRS